MMALDELIAQLEELWSHCDEVFAKIPESKWPAKFGRHWEYADVPRHLAYVDRTVVADGIIFGKFMPPEKQIFMSTHRQFNEWNARMLAEYRRTDSVELALEQMRKSRDAIRHAVAPLNDTDLDQPVWFPLTGFAGWRTVRYTLGFCRQHTWAHFTQLCLRLKFTPWKMNPCIIHGAVDSILQSLLPLLNDTLAPKVDLSAALIVTGAGGGCWIIKVSHGECFISESEAAPPRTDIILTATPETLIEILSDIRHPLAAMLTGRLQVRGLRHLPVFLQLFPRPNPDKPLVSSP